MSKFLRPSLFLALAMSLLATPTLLAQGVTSASIRGQVLSANGDPLPGATVSATHEPTGTRYTSITTSDGNFAMLNVRVGGPYTVTATLDGFTPQTLDGKLAQLGETVDLEFQLQLETVSETITVTSSSALINPSRTGAASNVSTELVDTLPTISRNLVDFARTSPFMAAAGENESPDAISVAGRSGRYNNIQIDGAVNNDLFGLADTGTPGGQADTNAISLDAIQEFQLLIAPFDVRQGGFTGGGINAVTRSGSNSYNGSVFFFTRDDSFVGDGPDELGEFGEFEEDQMGFRVGGPIRRDKAFFFVNGEFVEKTTPTGWSIDGSGGQTFADGEALDEAELFRQTLIDRYGFDPGSLGQDTRDTPSDLFFGRLDFNIGESNALTLRHNYVDAENDVNFPGSFSFEFPSEAYAFTSETNSTVAQLNTVISASSFNEARVTLQTIKDRRAGRDGVRFPWIEIENVIDQQTGRDLGEFEVGTEPFSTRNALDQDVLEITNDFTWVRGRHTLTLGTHNELFSFENLFIQNAFGSYEYATLEDFIAGRRAREYEVAAVRAGQPETQKFDVNQLGFYVGDQWAVTPQFNLTLGLRVDIPQLPDEPSRNEFTERVYGLRTDSIPDGNEIISPRVGFNWDIEGDGTQQLRGGIGVFGGRPPYVWISNNYARTGIEQAIFRVFGDDVPAFEPDPNNPPIPSGEAGTGEFNLVDPDFEYPTLMRYNVAYDRELPWGGLIGSVELVRGESIDEIDYRDVNLRQTGTLAIDGRPLFDRVESGVSGAYLLTNTSKGESTNIAVKVERPFRNGLTWFVSYTNGDSKTVNDGSSSRAVSNFQFNEQVDPNNSVETRSDFEIEHRFNALVSYQADWGGSEWPTTFSAFYNHQSGRPFSYIYGSQNFPSINGDRYFGNDLIYVPANESEVVVRNGTFAELDAFIRDNPCLEANRGGIAPRNCGDAPWSHTLDVRVAQDIPLPRTSLQVTLDIENFVNLFDSDAGALRYVTFNTTSPVSFRGFDDQGRIVYDLESEITGSGGTLETSNIKSRYRLKLGVRWSF
ncbi:MAG TPA: carboxypeptidase regulatory-like domain-containing protein [Thermoanaerobaculia bacterium]|nr:carboxypeptidase regulatory-like domain-containing protein [Thermoanaerobaculia bacterium]